MLRARLVRSLHGVAASLLYCTVHQTLPLLATLDRQGRLVVVDGDRDRHRVLAGTMVLGYCKNIILDPTIKLTSINCKLTICRPGGGPGQSVEGSPGGESR